VPRSVNTLEQTAALFERAALLQAQLPNVRSYAALSYIAPNDANFAATIEDAAVRTPSPTGENALALGVIVGNGYVNSIVPELPVDVVAMVDNDGCVLDWQRYVGACVRACPTAANFWERFADEAAYPKRIAQILDLVKTAGTLQDITKRFEYEREAFGPRHFLASEQRYQECRQAMLRTPFVYANANFVDVPTMQKVGAGLASAGEVTFFNPTNMVEHLLTHEYPAYLQGLGMLPVHQQVFVAYSSFVYQKSDGEMTITVPPRSCWTQGMDNYVADYQASLQWLPRYQEPPSTLIWGRQPGVPDSVMQDLTDFYKQIL